jgi:outer membrane receptor for monomeric catechols
LFEQAMKTATTKRMSASTPSTESTNTASPITSAQRLTFGMTISTSTTPIHEITPLKKSFDVYSYRIGTNYNFDPKNSLFLNYSTGFRAPTITQLLRGDVSTYGSTQNNPDLKPEHAKKLRDRFARNHQNVNYEASAFRIDRKDFIMKTAGNYEASTAR